ncbi:MAG TPA: hypothetical protein PKK23_15795 [Nitrospirales bacterium]|nr:hypothetical protein [Nitrospiraceae bacterium]HNP30509.1 hypothetical protein [Nitrospirales bacterium]
MAFNDSVTFEIVNIKGLEEARKLAPKLILATLKREYAREAAKFKTEFRKNYLFGPPGINLPRRAVGFTLKSKKKTFTKIKNKEGKGAQLSHVLTKVVVGKSGIVLVGYLSRFLGFHAAKLEQPFKDTFRKIEPRLRARIGKEAARITQQVLDKGLRDSMVSARRGK